MTGTGTGQLSFLTAMPYSPSPRPRVCLQLSLLPQSLLFNWPHGPESAHCLLYQVTLGQEPRNHTAVSQERLHGKGEEKTGIVEFQMAGSSGLLQGCGQSRGWDCGRDFQRWHLSGSAGPCDCV